MTPSLFRVHIVPVVEGHGDADSVPILIRRVADEIGVQHPEIASPIRCPKNKFLQEQEASKVLKLARLKLKQPGVILILLDADTDCPKELSEKILLHAKKEQRDLSVSCVLAKREYEAWFLASLESLRGKRGIVSDATAPPKSEEISGAKEYLTASMLGQQVYSETIDQPALTALFDLKQARKKSKSFDKFFRELEKCLRDISG